MYNATNWKNDIIIYEGGFRNKSDYSFINEIFRNNMIKVTSQDMFNGFPNIFSINNKKVVSDITFHKLNSILKERGYTVEKTMYREISSLEVYSDVPHYHLKEIIFLILY